MVALRKQLIARPADVRLRAVPLAMPPRVREDALPEHVEYRDAGCELSESCLRCPLARCKYDEPVSSRKLSVAARDGEIVLLRTRYRAPVDLLARTYGLSRRSVFRILSEAGYGRVRRSRLEDRG